MRSLVGSTPSLFRHPFKTMNEVFRGTIPDHLLYDIDYDMWVRREGGEVVIGSTAYGIFRAGKIIAFTAKPKGASVARYRGLGTVESAKTVLAVHAPIGFVLEAGNEALEDQPAMLNHDPYAAWMVRGQPIDWDTDSALLVDAETYRAHVLRCEPQAEIA
jgi:glycine cleavage system H protein